MPIFMVIIGTPCENRHPCILRCLYSFTMLGMPIDIQLCVRTKSCMNTKLKKDQDVMIVVNHTNITLMLR